MNRSTFVDRGVVHPIAPPLPFTVIAGGWPSALIALQVLRAPILSAYFPSRYHSLLPSTVSLTWKEPAPSRFVFNENSIVLLSGSMDFLRKALPFIPRGAPLLVSVETSMSQGPRARQALDRDVGARLDFVRGSRLEVTRVPDVMVGGATDGVGVFGTRNLPPLHLERTVERRLRHYVDGGVDAWTRCLRHGALPAAPSATGAVLVHRGVVRGEGLFPALNPTTEVYCPYHRKPQHLVVRPLTAAELLGLYNVPARLADVNWEDVDGGIAKTFPLATCPSAHAYTVILRSLWGLAGGGRTAFRPRGRSRK